MRRWLFPATGTALPSSNGSKSVESENRQLRMEREIFKKPRSSLPMDQRYHRCLDGDEGWLYLAVVMDLYSQAIVGWSMHHRMNQPLVCDALLMAICRRGFSKDTIIHSDRGSQYCSRDYQQLIEAHGLSGSMGHKATCDQNLC